jgi:hypothetical protein
VEALAVNNIFSRWAFALLMFFAYAPWTVAQEVHSARDQDQEWANITGFPVLLIQQVRGLVKGNLGDHIWSMDVTTLQKKGLIVVVTEGGTAHCPELYVLQVKQSEAVKIWESPDLAVEGFCADRKCGMPRFEASSNGSIRIFSGGGTRGHRCKKIQMAEFVRTEDGYKYVEGKSSSVIPSKP